MGTAFPFRYNQIELQQIVEEHGSELACITMEPIRSDQPQPGFLDGVRALADEIDAVLIIDEISAGFRMNTGGIHLEFGIKPDVVVFSKAMGNGYPIATIIGKHKVMDAQSTFISSTMWTERIGPTAALATIQKHRRFDVGQHLIAIGEQIQHGWKQCALNQGLKIHVGGIPPLSYFVFEYENALAMKTLFVQLMLERGFLASTIFYSMFSHQTHHVEQYLNAVDESFGILIESKLNGTLEKQLQGDVVSSGFKRLT